MNHSPSIELNNSGWKNLRSFFIEKKFDDLAKSPNSIGFVIPAKVGIQLFQYVLDPGFRRGDGPKDFLHDYQFFLKISFGPHQQ
jgi:hypothetical protein